MPITLPTARTAPTMQDPKITIIYGMPKVGKTESLVKLEDNLIIDFEEGTSSHNALAVHIKSYTEMKELITELVKKYTENGKKPVYKYISLDTLDELENIAKHKAADMYGVTAYGKPWYNKEYMKEGEDIANLPNGAGYYWIRLAMKWYIDVFAQLCDRLICTSHIKDKRLQNVEGTEETVVKDISLTGKLGSILCAKADAIGYMYRENNKLFISFQTNENSVMGSRRAHLGGNKFEMDWDKIFIDKPESNA